jgi:hypothetical protein
LEVDVIERVKRIRPNFQAYPFVNGKFFGETQIHVREARPDQRVSMSIAKGSWRGVGKRRGIEPLISGRIRDMWVAN